MSIKSSKSFHKRKRENLSKSHFNILLFELRNLKKDVEELKSFMNKSKGTIAVIVFISGIIAILVELWIKFKN
jgi:ABC-type antimicrobial peptide transport system permease subunit